MKLAKWLSRISRIADPTKDEEEHQWHTILVRLFSAANDQCVSKDLYLSQKQKEKLEFEGFIVTYKADVIPIGDRYRYTISWKHLMLDKPLEENDIDSIKKAVKALTGGERLYPIQQFSETGRISSGGMGNMSALPQAIYPSGISKSSSLPRIIEQLNNSLKERGVSVKPLNDHVFSIEQMEYAMRDAPIHIVGYPGYITTHDPFPPTEQGHTVILKSRRVGQTQSMLEKITEVFKLLEEEAKKDKEVKEASKNSVIQGINADRVVLDEFNKLSLEQFNNIAGVKRSNEDRKIDNWQ